jgi:membrane associated rhomboid family serine protease
MTQARWWFRAVPILVVVNTAVFLLEELLPRKSLSQLFDLFALTASGLAEGRWWQFLTHAFLHGGSPNLFLNLLHLVVNMVGLWFAGRIVERVMGTGRFLVLYAVSALTGGLAQVLLTGGNIPLIGASGAVCGVLIAFTTMFAEVQVRALLLFVIPLNLRAKYLGWLVAGSALFFQLTGLAPHIGHAAHLGGCVAGYLFARLAGYGEPGFLERWAFRKARRDIL